MHAKMRTAVRMPVRILGFASSQFAVRILEQPYNGSGYGPAGVYRRAYTPANQQARLDPIIRVRAGFLLVMHSDWLACTLEVHAGVSVNSGSLSYRSPVIFYQ